MRSIRNFILPLLAGATLACVGTSCLKSDVDDYESWKNENDAWLKTIDTNEYLKVAPDWAPENYIYVKWHNDRSLTEKNLVPFSTSTVKTKYEMTDINGKALGNSYTASTGDSVYQTQPQKNIVGFCAVLTMMHVGDSVTVIIPYNSAYGSESRGSILPYSNLIYHTKLKEIVAFEKPDN